MNVTILKALLEDARQQVLDNMVFRLMVVLLIVPISFTFLVGFGEERITILFGMWEIDYQTFLETFGGPPMEIGEVGHFFIQGVQEVFINFFGGTVGIIFCVAATAFFVPRMMEKGSADTLFSKPVSRATLLLARYFTGILFVAILAAVLVLGMFLGFWVTSGYSDPGFLWGALTLVYLYSLIHAFSIMVATWTRSSVAAILLSLMLFVISGGIHRTWMGMQWASNQELLTSLRKVESADVSEAEREEQEEAHGVVQVLMTTLEILHYTLPKTTDADVITAMLRRTLSGLGPVLEDHDYDVVVEDHPTGFAPEGASLDAFPEQTALWRADDGGAVRFRVEERPQVESGPSIRRRLRPLQARAAAQDFLDSVDSRTDPDLPARRETVRISGVQAHTVRWQEDLDGVWTDREAVFLTFAEGYYRLEIDLPAATLSEEERDEWREAFLEGITLGSEQFMDPSTWYRRQFDWGSPLAFNAFFSIGSSLAFASLMLALAWLRIRTVDF
ncbi:MAG: ABC transporter permease [Planctomycetota bacterium]|jgi:ABC-type transport system involved in multi-copper enzyme maturation permease subunit|nr:ABC transporter permease [Planctomycetota bacterium]MDP6761810.1 ABC transporter permease [Planctomycetota bacterium]MDP6988856.1 ABC transporter permease [Planctomycetota bacterium]